jgi:hypothetical protein
VKKIVWVETTGGAVTRIFRSQKAAFANCEDPRAMFKADAVGAIRRQVYDRQSGRCLWCGKECPYDGPVWKRMHLDEAVPKGRGGEVSLANCQCLCPECHLLGKHGGRAPRFGETK